MNNEESEPTTGDLHDAGINFTPGTTKSDVVAFLYRNPEPGYKPSEVAEHLDISHGTAATTLKCLYEARHIGKTGDGCYHALEHREDLRRYVASLDQLKQMFSQPTSKSL
ncbi:MarR family transcriptional regulator (plasmid) [Natrinema thermotolerans]|uniref:MarR family transcriptional regulator n=1 Tax=Natrinema thermotolerans TaxID=121872 RepID=A0AAF0PKN6_9EURY|nr:MarR family transcriptional regulator [Natrinema thermotolerans]WMT10258.1 MarR family transcriptional regulator [Natrinema thermotolerans]